MAVGLGKTNPAALGKHCLMPRRSLPALFPAGCVSQPEKERCYSCSLVSLAVKKSLVNLTGSLISAYLGKNG